MSIDECGEYVKALRPLCDRHSRGEGTRLFAPIEQHWESLVRSHEGFRRAVAGQHVPGVVLPHDFYNHCCDPRALSLGLALPPLRHLMEVEKGHPAALFHKDYPLECRAWNAMLRRQWERWSEERRRLPWLDMPGSEELPPQPQAPPPPRGHQTFYPPQGKAASGSEDNLSATSPAEEVAPGPPPGKATTVVTIPLPPPPEGARPRSRPPAATTTTPIPPPPTRPCPRPGATQAGPEQPPRPGAPQAGPEQRGDDYMARWLRGREVIRRNHFNGGYVPESLPTKAPPASREQRPGIDWPALHRQVVALDVALQGLLGEIEVEEAANEVRSLRASFLQLGQSLDEVTRLAARPKKRPRKGAAHSGCTASGPLGY